MTLRGPTQTQRPCGMERFEQRECEGEELPLTAWKPSGNVSQCRTNEPDQSAYDHVFLL